MKRFTKAAAVIATVTGLCLVGLVIVRIPLAETVIEHWLSGQGLADPEVDIRRLGLAGMSASVVRAGPGGEAQAGALEMRWTVSELVRGRIGSIGASRVRIPLDWQDDGISVAGVSVGSPDSTSARAEGPTDLPFRELHLRDVTFDVSGLYGPASLSLTRLDIDRSPNGAVALSGELELTGPQGDLQAAVEASGRSEDSITGELSNIRGKLAFGPLAVTGLTGNATFGLDALRPHQISASLAAMHVDHPLAPWPPSGPASLRLVHDAEGTELSLDIGGADAPERLVIKVLAEPLRFEDNFAATSATVRANVEIVDRPELTLRDVDLEMPLTLAYEGGVFTTRFISPGTVTFTEFEAANVGKIFSPTTLRVGGGDAPALRADLEVNTLDLDLFVEADRLDLAVPAASSRELRFRTGFVRAGLNLGSEGQTLTGAVSVEAPVSDELAVSASSGSIEFIVSGSVPELDITARIADFRQDGMPALVSPVDIALHAAGPFDSISFEGEATSTGGVQVATLSGSYPSRDGAPLAGLDIGPFTFAPGGLQPGTLSPALSAMEDVEGEAGFRIVVPGAGPASGTFHLKGLSFTLAGQRVLGLDSRIAIRDLTTPVTAPDQSLTIDRIDLPVSVEDVRARFAIGTANQNTPELELDLLHLETLGGSIEAGPQRILLQPNDLALDLRVQGLDLARIFEIADVDGVSGTGRLAGAVPLAIEDGDIAIHSAMLTSDSGVLRIRSDKASDFLSGQGQSVDAALRALEDFRYSELSIGADKAAGGDAQLAISLLGHNPAVLDGHPFRFNVNLTSNIDELVEALLRGYRIATDAVSRAGPRP